MKKISYLFLIVFLVSFSWWLGRPGNPPPLPIALSDSKNNPQVLGSETDKMSPISRFVPLITQAKKGDTIFGEANDLGVGVAQVVIQIQRASDGAVWNGQNWGENIGETLDAELTGLKFKFTVPVELETGERYIFRSQAIDFAGNAQTKWDEVIFVGSESPKTI